MDNEGCGIIMDKHQPLGLEPSLETTELMPTVYKGNLGPERRDLPTECF